MGSVLLLLLVTLQAGAAQETADLIRKLGSDVLTEREQATARLKQIGPSVSPALQNLLKTGDIETRERAREILAEFEREARVQSFRPSNRRITVHLDQTPLSEAVPQLLHPFGMTGAKVDPAAAGWSLTLDLKDATFWEALELLERQANVKVDLRSGRIDPATEKPVARPGSGEVRFSAEGWGGRGGSGGPTRKALFVKAWLPPGTWVCLADLNDIVVTDETENEIEAKWLPDLETVRREGLPTSVGMGTLAILPDKLKNVKSVTLRGNFRWGYARNLERFVMSPVPGKLGLLGGSLEIDKLSKEPDKEWWDLTSIPREGARAGRCC